MIITLDSLLTQPRHTTGGGGFADGRPGGRLGGGGFGGEAGRFAAGGLGCGGTAPGELGWGGPISAEAVRRIGCDAGISRVITDPASVPLDVGREQRTVTAGQWAALVVRDRGCAFPGCTRPSEWCIAHHITHWADGGPTNLNNLRYC